MDRNPIVDQYPFTCIIVDQSIKKNSFIHFWSLVSPRLSPKHTLHHHYGACYRRHFSDGFLYLPSTCSFHSYKSTLFAIYTFFTLVIHRFISLVSQLTCRSNQYLTAEAFWRPRVFFDFAHENCSTDLFGKHTRILGAAAAQSPFPSFHLT